MTSPSTRCTSKLQQTFHMPARREENEQKIELKWFTTVNLFVSYITYVRTIVAISISLRSNHLRWCGLHSDRKSHAPVLLKLPSQPPFSHHIFPSFLLSCCLSMSRIGRHSDVPTWNVIAFAAWFGCQVLAWSRAISPSRILRQVIVSTDHGIS